MGAHTGRCFRALRRTKKCGTYHFPIRQKVPLVLRAFLSGGDARQQRAGASLMNLAIAQYAQHQIMVGNTSKHAARGR